MSGRDMEGVYQRWAGHLADYEVRDAYGYRLAGEGREEARQRVLNDLLQRMGQGALGLVEHTQWLRLIAARNRQYLPLWEECDRELVPELQHALATLYQEYPAAEAKLREAYETQRGLLREQRAGLLKSLHAVTGKWNDVAGLVGKSRAALGQEVDAVPSFSPFAQVSVPLPGYKVAERGTQNTPGLWAPGDGNQLLFLSHTAHEAVADWYRSLARHAEEENFRLVSADLTGRMSGQATPRHVVWELLKAASQSEVTAGLPWKPATLLVVTGVEWREGEDALTKRLVEVARQAQAGLSDFAVVVHLAPKEWPVLIRRHEEGAPGPWAFAREAPLAIVGPPEEGLCVKVDPYWAGGEPPEARRDRYLGAWRDADGTYGWLRKNPGIYGPRKAAKRLHQLEQSEERMRGLASLEGGDEA